MKYRLRNYKNIADGRVWSVLFAMLLIVQTPFYFDDIKGSLVYKSSDYAVGKATIMKSVTVRKGRYHVLHYDIIYVFRVGDEIYDSTQVTFSRTSDTPKEYVKKYPEGKLVKVFYDKDNPHFSVLEPDVKGEYIIVRLSIFLLASLFFWLLSRYQGDEYKAI